ncbi:peptidase, partial [Halorubrum sp. E3]
MLTVALLVGVAVLTFLAVEIGPLYAADRFRDLREPTDGERGRLDFLRETAGLEADRVAIERRGADEAGGANDGVGRVEVAVRGPPRRRVLFLSEAVLDDVDEDVALGLL